MASNPDAGSLRAAEADARHLREAARNFFPGQHAVSVIGRSSGFSGSTFAGVEDSGRSWCLRRWPSDFGEQRLRFVHRVLVASRWLKLLRAAAELASEAFSERLGLGYAVCHGDLWPAHVHFDGDAFVGFTDFESLSFASPALDLAQLTLHFGGWEIREDVLRGYESVAPLDERDRSLLPIEAVIDLAGEGYWALEALYGTTSSRTTPEQKTAHLLNLRELVVSMDLVATEIGLGR